jgi:hypothetical protein
MCSLLQALISFLLMIFGILNLYSFLVINNENKLINIYRIINGISLIASGILIIYQKNNWLNIFVTILLSCFQIINIFGFSLLINNQVILLISNIISQLWMMGFMGHNYGLLLKFFDNNKNILPPPYENQ